jgi:phosphoglycolate phosphatase
MSLFKDVKTIIFDYDGTLHQSMDIYYPAFLKAYQFLVKEKHMTTKTWLQNDVKHFLGQNPKEMWQTFLPDADDMIRHQASTIIKDEMIDQIKNYKAKLYEGTFEVLTYLKQKGYHLIYLSNANNYYMHIHKEVFNLGDYFDLMLTSQMFDYQPKDVMLKSILDQLEKEVIVIGDRHYDIHAAQALHLRSIGCLYGYGHLDELKDASVKINDIRELLSIL